MKRFLALLAAVPFALHAHDHVDVGVDSSNPNLLAMQGPSYQLATYFPLGESPSFYLPAFPGGYFASELTFSVSGDVEELAIPNDPTRIRIEIVSISGPVAGVFSFWEAGATSPTWTRPAGWSSVPGDEPGFPASEAAVGAPGGAYGHIHGRVFTVTQPGTYTIDFRAVDAAGAMDPSANHTIQFEAITAPQLTITLEGGQARLTFTSRLNLVYDVQRCTNLSSGVWTTIGDPLDGTGATLEFFDPLAGRPRSFYRLIEYQ